MSLATEAAATARAVRSSSAATATPPSEPAYQVIRRNGSVSPFDSSKIAVALTKAFLAVEGTSAAASRRVHDIVTELTDLIVASLTRRSDAGRTFHIEDIQDQAELALMRSEHHKVARAYVLYREERARQRAKAQESKTKKGSPAEAAPVLRMKAADGSMTPLDTRRLAAVVEEACAGLEDVSAETILSEAHRNLYDGISADELALAPILAARTLVETDPDYAKASARLLLDKLRREALSFVAGRPEQATQAEMTERYAEYFRAYVRTGIEHELLDPEIERFDLDRLAAALKPERDLQFDYLGFQTLYDRYFLHVHGVRFELPQAFFMRVACGLALREIDREDKAIEFYDLLSSFDFMASTPTLFNAGTLRPQLSSCFLTSVPDDLDGIFKAIKDNALLSKYAGGLGNDWTRVR
ncbi:MAG TPA: ATP cone domain-containing protein, partial [Nitrobacter sp.]|nr:ATP cone domain-containing protein [Nitrobacter sp.]